MRIRVVLPAPLAPSSPTTSPEPTARSTPSTAVNRPKTLLTPAHSASISASAISGSAISGSAISGSAISGIGAVQLCSQRRHAHRVLQVGRHLLSGDTDGPLLSGLACGLLSGLACGLLSGLAGGLPYPPGAGPPPGPAALILAIGTAGHDHDGPRYGRDDLGRGALGEGPPRVEDEHVRRPRRLVQVGGGHQHGRAARGGPRDEPP